ncbi:cell division protein SepF [Pseudoscardovia radai]|jgi:cell division inhibitor SepF|uniref:Cell division protein SepF n=1 Tax=Pseudoscardovia radai TaxID=987066 RepID=A0A261EYR4_9BIFI|nr:cell division protein SepF [Pseudoscardovia radai]OZG51806.1 cell division protein SepF [Pseudoscardovia radai]
MAGFMKNAMTYLGMADPADDEDVYDYEDDDRSASDEAFDSGAALAPQPMPSASDVSGATRSTSVTPFRSQMKQIMTISPKSYNEAQLIGRALRSGVPVVLNLSEAPDSEAYRIIDFSSGVVYGLQGSIERVTSRVYILSPAQVELSGPEDDDASSIPSFN